MLKESGIARMLDGKIHCNLHAQSQHNNVDVEVHICAKAASITAESSLHAHNSEDYVVINNCGVRSHLIYHQYNIVSATQ